MEEDNKRGQVRVGTCKYTKNGRIDPKYEGFTKIVCLTASSAYGCLSPYCLTTEINGEDVILENAWQFSKVYECVYKTVQTRSRFDKTVIWEWPAQVHAEKNNNVWSLTLDYVNWRNAGMAVKEPIRYPVGRNNMGQCLFSLKNNSDGSINPKMLNYIEGRKEIYLPVYCESVKKHTEFIKLKERLDKGENLLIVEVDGPRSRSLEYYKKKYDVGDDFIQDDTILMDEKILDIMLNDEKERFGHGYCLAGCLLDLY